MFSARQWRRRTPTTRAKVSVVVDSSRYSILIADDDDSHRCTLRDVFEPRGYHTLLASNGQEALEILQFEPVHCVILDVHMPRLCGLETLRIVRESRFTLPCILVTADPSEQVVNRALALRAFTVLTKPVSLAQVTSSVRDALQASYRSA